MVNPDMVEQNIPTKKMGLITFAASLGSLFEWYDFFLSSFVAGTVWPIIFFASGNIVVATALSISAYGVSFLARPVGAFIFGHMGDRLGRKTTLVMTIAIIAVGTLGIGLTPDYSVVGSLAPVLIVLFRIIQGVGFGGEFGGAISWVSEFASRSKHRGFWAGWVQVTAATGATLASLAYVIAGEVFAHSFFLSVGWRIPYFIGTVALVIGIYIRYRTEESPLFKNLIKTKKPLRSPSLEIFRKQGKTLFFMVAVILTNFLLNVGPIPFSISYIFNIGLAHKAANVNIPLASFSILIGNTFAIFTTFVGAYLSDRIGRKKVLLLSSVLVLIFIYPYFYLIDTLVPTNIIVAQMLWLGAEALGYGTLASLLSEHFSTEYRYSGTGLTYQIGAVFIGIITTFAIPAYISIAKGVVGAGPYVAVTSAVICIISIVSIMFLKETKDITLDSLDVEVNPN